MKRILSLILVLTLICSLITALTVPVSAQTDNDNNKLIITCRRQVIGEVEVGSEFIYHVALDSGGYNVTIGEGQLRYDDSYATIVEYGTPSMSAYSFPTRIRNTSLATNFLNEKNVAYYDYVKIAGVGAFTEDDHYFKIRMKAVAPGTVEIRHYTKCLYSGLTTKLIYDDISNNQLDPIPYTICTVEPAAGYVGDADGDYELTVLDATMIQHLSAGEDLAYNMISADSNGDDVINLFDALNILRYHAGLATQGSIGEWVFESEA